MIKLAVDFEASLEVSGAFTQMAALSRIIALEAGRAVVFGWGTHKGVHAAGAHGHWLAELSRQGVSTRVLPTGWTHGVEALSASRPESPPPQLFRLGPRFGLLLSSRALLLFDSVQAEPVRIDIENHFLGLGELAHPSHQADSHYEIVHCGPGSEGCVPVVLAAPTGRGAGRHLALLQIDAERGSACWRHLRVDGSPRTLNPEDYSGFDESGMFGTVAQIDPQACAPIVSDCGWTDKHWLVYAAGYHKNLVRFGVPLGVLTRNLVDLDVLEPVFRPAEQSLATICASLDRMIVSPLHKSGPRKGRQTVFTLADAQEHGITLPRGFAKHQVLDHAEGTYWLAPMPMGYDRLPVTLLACRPV